MPFLTNLRLKPPRAGGRGRFLRRISGPPARSLLKEGRVGIGFKVSLLGAGVELATPVAHRANVGTGFNLIDYRSSFDNDEHPSQRDHQLQDSGSAPRLFPPGERVFLSAPESWPNIGDPITANAMVAARP